MSAEVNGKGSLPKGAEHLELHALVHGHVQGVSYRDFTREHARRRRLLGWVRNMPDGGTVEVMAQGSKPALEQLLYLLRQGPTGAVVDYVEVEWRTPMEAFGPFEIRA